MCAKQKNKNEQKMVVVSSAHLAKSEGWELSELEYGLILLHNSFSNWVTRCMSAAGNSDLNALDVLVLHNVNHRSRSKKIADICFMLNIEDQHVVSYSLKKLCKLNFVSKKKIGKEIFFQTSQQGNKICEKYRSIREGCLLSAVKSSGYNIEEFREIALKLRTFSGYYAQASRVASTL